MNQPRDQRLAAFLIDAFNHEGLSRWIAYRYPVLSPTLPPKAALAEFAHAFVTEARRHGLIDATFFSQLAAERPRRAAEVEALRGAWRDHWLREPSHTSIVLDRILQWGEILRRCAEDPKHLVILVHGDREQDLDLFVLRIKGYLNHPGNCPRYHSIAAISRTREGSPALTPEDWTRRICEKLGFRTSDLAAALERSTRACAALLVLEDEARPLRGLRGQDFEELGKFFHDALHDALVRVRTAYPARPHPIRIVVPVEHLDDGAAVQRALDGLVKRLRPREPDLVVVRPRELSFPTLKDVREHVFHTFPDLDPKRWALCEALFKRVKQAHERTLRDLADPLEDLLSTWTDERMSGRKD